MSLVGFRASNHPQQVGKRGATERDNLGTDPALFAALNERFRFTLDVAATPENAKCDHFISAEMGGDLMRGGLELPWTTIPNERVWCNPPYSQIGAWVAKAWCEWNEDESCLPPLPSERHIYLRIRPQLIVMLLPANRPEQAWWQEMVEPFRDRPGSPLRTEFLRGRQRFVLPGAESIGPNERPPFGCVLLIWQDQTDDAGQQKGGNAREAEEPDVVNLGPAFDPAEVEQFRDFLEARGAGRDLL